MVALLYPHCGAKMEKKCLLLIHGLGSDENETWGDFKKAFDARKRSNHAGYEELKIETFSYSSRQTELQNVRSAKDLTENIIGKLLSDKSSYQISKFADLLDTEITEKAKYRRYKEIYIVAHSMGGIITARYLLNMLKQQRPTKVQKVVFLATPFWGSPYVKNTLGFLFTKEAIELGEQSQFLKDLWADWAKYKFDKKILSTLYFADHDTVISVPKAEAHIVTGRSKMLRGGHSSLLQGNNLNNNFDLLERTLLDQTTFIANLAIRYDKSTSFIMERPISDENIENQLKGGNLLTEILTKHERDIFTTMLNSISYHSYSPHRTYEGRQYYTAIAHNEDSLDEHWGADACLLWPTVSAVPRVLFYVGQKGCGKTLTQNMWIDRHYVKLEEHNIFHVRCDVHKIYDIYKQKSASDITIDNYLHMQFLYIFLKYRDGKYNNKPNRGDPGNPGAQSDLMRRIDNLLCSQIDEDFCLQNGETLASFLDAQSRYIYHAEVNLRPDKPKFSYALFLMKQSPLSEEISGKLWSVVRPFFDGTLTDIEILLSGLEPHLGLVLTKREHDDHKHVDSIDWRVRSAIIEKSKRLIEDTDTTPNGRAYSLMATLEKLCNSGIVREKCSVANAWVEVSKLIQNVILRNNFKIIRMIDGIDNIAVQRSVDDANFYKSQITHLRNMLDSSHIPGVYYWITLRDDTLVDLGVNVDDSAEYDATNPSDTENETSPRIFHNMPTKGDLIELGKKRFEHLLATLNNDGSSAETLSSKYVEIIRSVFALHTEWPDLYHVDFNNNTREMLRHKLFLSLNVYLALKNELQGSVSDDDIHKLIEERLNESIFLRDRYCVNTGRSINKFKEAKHKAFPNVFHFNIDQSYQGTWLGLAGIRILQLLDKNELSIIDVKQNLMLLYPETAIQDKIDTFMAFNLIKTKLNALNSISERNILYSITGKGKAVLRLIKSDINILYFLCLDTPLPRSFTSECFIRGFEKNIGTTIDTGYINAVVKSVTTFIVYLSRVHEDEKKKVQTLEAAIEWFDSPIDVVDVDRKLRSLYRRKRSAEIDVFFKQVGAYSNDGAMESDLKRYHWT
jgi:pimeloyl-ACP methyl ester carboxylesterase